MKKYTVHIESWQIQCCGDRFKVGESVKWRVIQYNKVMKHYESAGKMDYYYENHPTKSDGYFVFTGIVAGIDVMFTRFIPDPSKGKKWIQRSDAYIKPVREAAIWVKNENKHEFDGYIVYFEEYQIRLEEKDEQYPKKLRHMNMKRIEEGFNELFPDEVITGLIRESGGILDKDIIRKKYNVDVLRNLVGGDPFYYFDDDSYKKLDLKIEVLTALNKGMSPKDIPQYDEIFELLPTDVQLLDK
jgi:hypothetical protein